MKRIASGSQAASAPASYGADVGTPGYFQDAATTPAGAPTQLTAKWANMVQEAVVQPIEEAGLTLSDNLGQFAQAIRGVHATWSATADTGNTETTNKRGLFAGKGKATGAGSAVIASTAGGGYCLASGAGSAVVASDDSTASGTLSAVIGANASTASGTASAVVGGTGSTATGANAVALGGNGDATGPSSAVIAGDGATASGTNAVVIGGITTSSAGDNAVAVGGSTNMITSAGDRSVIAGGLGASIDTADSFAAACSTVYTAQGQQHSIVSAKDSTTCDVAGTARVILASRGVALASSKTTGGNASYVVGGGYSTNTVSGLETANADVKWTIDSQTGNFLSAGTFTGSGDPNADVAEYHENVTAEAVPVGALVTNVGRKVRLALPGDRVFGVVSATPLIVAGSAELGWAGQYLTDPWGRPIWVDVPMVRFGAYDGRVDQAPQPIPEGAELYTAQDRARNPDYDPTRPYVARSDRPTEWTPVAKLGLVRVRVDWNVAVGDLLAPGSDGVAVATDDPHGRREVEVLEILSSYESSRGYAIALCEVG